MHYKIKPAFICPLNSISNFNAPQECGVRQLCHCGCVEVCVGLMKKNFSGAKLSQYNFTVRFRNRDSWQPTFGVSLIILNQQFPIFELFFHHSVGKHTSERRQKSLISDFGYITGHLPYLVHFNPRQRGSTLTMGQMCDISTGTIIGIEHLL